MSRHQVGPELTVTVRRADDIIIMRLDASSYRLATALALTADTARAIGTELLAIAGAIELDGHQDLTSPGT